MPSVGIVIGRFQVPELHAGHVRLLKTVADRHDKLCVYVGVSPFILTKRNPLPVEGVMRTVRQAFTNLSITSKSHLWPLPDNRDDGTWSSRLDTVIDTMWYGYDVRLYTGRDGFNSRYNGKYPVTVLETVHPVSATEVRESLDPNYANVDFRKGVIYAITNQYDSAKVCVDCIVTQDTDSKVLLVRKHNEEFWRFPGGFVDTTDTSLEHAVRRELAEEASLVWHSDPIYQFSKQVKDWRSELTTAVFRVQAETGNFEPTDEIADQRWFAKEDVADVLVPEHKPLWRTYLDG